MSDSAKIQASVKEFILNEFLPGENPDDLTPDTELMTSGIIDSIATLKLVSHLESTYDIAIAAHEADAENLNTLEGITALVASKLG
jgi:acyl carrier protein